jgi:hypothetical protein
MGLLQIASLVVVAASPWLISRRCAADRPAVINSDLAAAGGQPGCAMLSASESNDKGNDNEEMVDVMPNRASSIVARKTCRRAYESVGAQIAP